jgi:CHAT domain-containing protein/tetratricopeptide (TPR) repeat protein
MAGGTLVLVMLTAACANAPLPDELAVRQDPRLEPGLELYWRSEYDSASALWQAELGQARAAGDSLGAANVLTWLGLAAYRTGDFAAARSFGEAALALKLTLPGPTDVARSWNALGLLAMAEDRLVDARELLDRAHGAAEAAGDHRTAGAAAGNLGLVHAYLGDLDEAGVLLRQMRVAGAAASDHRLEANAFTNLAMVAVWAGEPHAALAPLDTARALYREQEYPAGELHALGQLATALAAMGEYPGSLAALDSALALARRHGMRDQEVELLRLLGVRFAELGDGRRALRHFDDAAELARDLGLASELGSALQAAAGVHLSLGAIARARADALAALAAHRQAVLPFEELDDLLLLARIHREAGEIRAAEAALREAEVVAVRLGSRGARAAVRLGEARHAGQTGEPRRALRAATLARAESIDGDFRSRMEAHALAARAWRALGVRDSAALEGRAAVAALERVRTSLGSTELRGSFAAAAADVYGEAVMILLELGETAEAFAIADAARSRELLQRLSADRRRAEAAATHRDPTAGIGAAELLLRRIDALLAQLRILESLPPDERGAGAAVTATEITTRIRRLRDEYESIQLRTARAGGRPPRLFGAVRADGAALRMALAPDEALLHYTVRPDRLIIFVARSDRLETLQLPIAAAELASRVRLLRALWGTAGSSPERGLPAAQSLYAVLIGSVERAGLLDGASRLVLVPHGVLEQLPFAALHDPASHRFLVEDFVLTHAPSANALIALRGTAAGGLRDTGDGFTRRSRTGAVAAFAPFPLRLPGTRTEAITARRAAPGGRVHVGSRASERAVRRALGQDLIVHVATHGVLNARNPMFSRVELARSRRRSPENDGRLEVHEVLRLDVRSPLVVLSGCETAAGDDWYGDPSRPAGLSTLAQAFLHAGASNVAATLWRIDDAASAGLVDSFYRADARTDPALALARAQRAMIRSSEHAAPYYWAGYQLLGEGRVRPAAQRLAGLPFNR